MLISVVLALKLDRTLESIDLPESQHSLGGGCYRPAKNQLRCENRAPFYHSTDRRRTNSAATQETRAASFKHKKQQHILNFEENNRREQ